jgi:hypothetical protein
LQDYDCDYNNNQDLNVNLSKKPEKDLKPFLKNNILNLLDINIENKETILKSKLCLDFGATVYYSPYKDWFLNYKSIGNQ